MMDLVIILGIHFLTFGITFAYLFDMLILHGFCIAFGTYFGMIL